LGTLVLLRAIKDGCTERAVALAIATAVRSSPAAPKHLAVVIGALTSAGGVKVGRSAVPVAHTMRHGRQDIAVDEDGRAVAASLLTELRSFPGSLNGNWIVSAGSAVLIPASGISWTVF